MTKEISIVKVVEGKYKNAISESESIVVKNDEDLTRASTVLTNLKKFAKWIKQEKEKIVKPINEALKVERARWAPYEDGIERAENNLKSAIIIYQDKKDAEIRKKQEALTARVEKGQIKPETAIAKMEVMPEEKQAVYTGTGTVAFSKIKKVRVVDQNLVPDKYWVIDGVLLRKDVLAGVEVPGAEIYEETNINTRV